MDNDGSAPSGAAHVLLLCTDERLGAALRQVLAQRGHAVELGHCAADGLDDVRAAAPDVIVIETCASNTAGLSLCQSIRQVRDLDGLKLLLLQDQGRAIDRRRAEALGANGFLAMPFPMAMFCDEVGRLTGGR